MAPCGTYRTCHNTHMKTTTTTATKTTKPATKPAPKGCCSDCGGNGKLAGIPGEKCFTCEGRG